MSNHVDIVHCLVGGKSVCGINGSPRDWPPGHQWVGGANWVQSLGQLDELGMKVCAVCRAKMTLDVDSAELEKIFIYLHAANALRTLINAELSDHSETFGLQTPEVGQFVRAGAAVTPEMWLRIGAYFGSVIKRAPNSGGK